MRYIIGLGSHSEVIYAILKQSGDDITFLSYSSSHADKLDEKKLPAIAQGRYGGDIQSFIFSTKHDGKNDGFIIAIGDNKLRKEIAQRYSNLKFINAIHNRAVIIDECKSGSIGGGNVICAGATIATGARIGHHNIINTNTSIDHHNVIGDYCHVAPNCALCGNVTLYDGVFLGVSSSVTPGVKIAPWSWFKANTLVKESTGPIPIYEPYIQKYKTSMMEAVTSGWVSCHGKYVQLATDKMKSILKAKHVLLLNNGTSATHCLFLALKYKYPHIRTIYVPNNVYVAAWNAIFMAYSPSEVTVKVMRMDLFTWNIDTEAKYISSLDKDAAMLVVHNVGGIVNVPRLKRLRPDIIFIEDNCEGLFGRYRDIAESGDKKNSSIQSSNANAHTPISYIDGGWMYTGTFPGTLCASVSFFGNKTVTTGEGGGLIINDDDVFAYLTRVCNQGNTSTRYIHDVLGYNYRITNVQAAMLYDQLCDIDHILSLKHNIFTRYYDKLISQAPDKICPQKQEEGTQRANWLFPVRLHGKSNAIISQFMASKGIDTRPMFYPIETHAHLKHLSPGKSGIPHEEIIMLPSSPTLPPNVQDHIIDMVIALAYKEPL